MRNARGEILICQRPAHKIYPGEWEFPGGKVEPGESVEQALARELHEELGIRVTGSRPLIRVRYEYPELAVDLDTWLVTAFEGKPVSREHPASAWVKPDDLPRWQLLAADRPIVNALRLPSHYVFTPARRPGRAPAVPDALLRLRLPEASAEEYRAAARRSRRIPLMIDRWPSRVAALSAAGFHATASALKTFERRPVPRTRWFAASCHDAGELALARKLGVDFVVLGPVKATATHPGAAALGWDGFERLARGANVPVYAIGGMTPADLSTAWRRGAQGIAGISAFWRSR